MMHLLISKMLQTMLLNDNLLPQKTIWDTQLITLAEIIILEAVTMLLSSNNIMQNWA